ncbi:MAG: TAT-variant-translocated molybdopterin oxidoreductase [Verrucomicrobiota bacterium]
MDLSEVRETLSEQKGRGFWQGLEQLSDNSRFKDLVRREFPRHHNAFIDVDRRDFLKLAGASMAFAGLTGCTRQPMEKIVPYVRAPEEIVPGRPLYYATTMTLAGYGYGLLAESHVGRPTKLTGNSEHPGSAGGTTTQAQAAILDLYDPDRSQKILHLGRSASWEKFSDTILSAMQLTAGIGDGSSLRILSESQSSPTLQAQWAEISAKFPNAQWIQYDPVNRDDVQEGSRIAFGEYVETIYSYEKADVVVSIGADFLETGQGHLPFSRDYTSRRDPEKKMNRLYVIESVPTLTGGAADHRRPVSPADVENYLRAIAARIGVDNDYDDHKFKDGDDKKWLDAIVGDLEQAKGKSVVVVGDDQPAAVHALCWNWVVQLPLD